MVSDKADVISLVEQHCSAGMNTSKDKGKKKFNNNNKKMRGDRVKCYCIGIGSDVDKSLVEGIAKVSIVDRKDIISYICDLFPFSYL